MINDFFIDCELFSRTELTNPSGGKYWGYAKTSDIKGIMYPKKEKVLIEGVWKFIDVSIFMTTDAILKTQQVKYKGQLYKCVGTPEDPMEIGHHIEVLMELIDNV